MALVVTFGDLGRDFHLQRIVAEGAKKGPLRLICYDTVPVEIPKGVSFRWIHPFLNCGVKSYLLAPLRLLVYLLELLVACFKFSPSVVYFKVTNLWFDSLLSWLFAAILRARLVFDLSSVKIHNPDEPKGIFAQKMEIAFLSLAHLCVCPSKAMALILSMRGIKTQTISALFTKYEFCDKGNESIALVNLCSSEEIDIPNVVHFGLIPPNFAPTIREIAKCKCGVCLVSTQSVFEPSPEAKMIMSSGIPLFSLRSSLPHEFRGPAQIFESRDELLEALRKIREEDLGELRKQMRLYMKEVNRISIETLSIILFENRHI